MSRRRSPERTRRALYTLRALGTLAHNRAFTTGEVSQYVGRDVAADIALFRRRGWLRAVEGRRLYPTKRGWRAIEVAHALEGQKIAARVAREAR